MTSGYSIPAAVKTIQEKTQSIDLLNVYKGVPISIQAFLRSTSPEEVVAEVRPPESICLLFERNTLIRHASLPNLVRARVNGFDPHTGLVRLGAFQFSRSKFIQRSQVRVEPRNPIRAELEFRNHKIVGTLADISLIGIGLYISSSEYEFALNRAENVSLILHLPTGKIRSEGKLRGMGKSVDFCRLAINFCGNTPENAIVQHYIADRQSEILLELHHLYEENVRPAEVKQAILN